MRRRPPCLTAPCRWRPWAAATAVCRRSSSSCRPSCATPRRSWQRRRRWARSCRCEPAPPPRVPLPASATTLHTKPRPSTRAARRACPARAGPAAGQRGGAARAAAAGRPGKRRVCRPHLGAGGGAGRQQQPAAAGGGLRRGAAAGGAPAPAGGRALGGLGRRRQGASRSCRPWGAGAWSQLVRVGLARAMRAAAALQQPAGPRAMRGSA
jgi:hypothetical protein